MTIKYSKFVSFIIIISLLILSACQQEKVTAEDTNIKALMNENISEKDGFNIILEKDLNAFNDFLVYSKEDGIFRVNSFVNKLKFKEAEEIKLYSTLEYIGENQNIEIWHGIPCFNYTIEDGKDFSTGGITLDVLEKSVIKKGEIYLFPYTKNGGFSEDDEDSEFWKKFYQEENLYLPKGEYQITAFCAFSLSENYKDKYSNSVEVTINVSN